MQNDMSYATMAQDNTKPSAKMEPGWERKCLAKYVSKTKLIEFITTKAQNHGVMKSDGTAVKGADLEIEVRFSLVSIRPRLADHV